MSETVIEPYNAVLSTNNLVENSDITCCIDVSPIPSSGGYRADVSERSVIRYLHDSVEEQVSFAQGLECSDRKGHVWIHE